MYTVLGYTSLKSDLSLLLQEGNGLYVDLYVADLQSIVICYSLDFSVNKQLIVLFITHYTQRSTHNTVCYPAVLMF